MSTTINGVLLGMSEKQAKGKVAIDCSMRAYMEHKDHGSGAIVELYMTPYNTFTVQVMLDNGTIIELVKGAVAGNALNIQKYGPTYAVDNTIDEDVYYEGS